MTILGPKAKTIAKFATQILRLAAMLRTHTCGELRIEQVGETVNLCGWVQTVRDKGNLLWIDLRDRYGLTQLQFQEGVTDQH